MEDLLDLFDIDDLWHPRRGGRVRAWVHRLLGHKQRVRESKLISRQDYRFCSCGAVFRAI